MSLFPFEPKSLQTITRRVVDDVRTRLGTAASLLQHTAEAALAGAVAGVAHPLWRAIDRAARASLWATTLDLTYLEIWASLFGVYRKDPTKATGTLLMQGSDGTTVPAGTRWQRSPDAFEYVTTEEVTIGILGEVAVGIQAKTAGAIGNVKLTTPLFLIGNIPGLEATATISAADINNGIDRESLYALASRFFDRLRNPPRGGGKGDYVRWAKELAFVTRAWEYGGEPQLGYVTVRAVTDFADDDTNELGSDAREALRAYIQDRMPLGLQAVVPGDVVVVGLDPTIKLQPNTAAVQDAAKKALYQALSMGPIGPGSFSLSLLNQALLNEPLVQKHEFVDPVGNVALAELEVLTLGNPVFQAF